MRLIESKEITAASLTVAKKINNGMHADIYDLVFDPFKYHMDLCNESCLSGHLA